MRFLLVSVLLQCRSMPVKDRNSPFQTLFESSPDAILIQDAKGNVLDCNPAAATLHGLTREQLIGKHASELVPPEQRSRVVTLQSSPPLEFQSCTLTSDGRSIPVSIRTSCIDYLGQPALLLHVRDITEYKRFEHELQRSNDELENRVR